MASVYLPGGSALFLHLPKTAGHSLSTALTSLHGAKPLPVRGMRLTVGAARFVGARLGQGIFAETFSFAVVRNPWDWAVSGWKHVTENTDAYPEEKPGFEAFLTGGWRRGLQRNPDRLKFSGPEMFVRYHCFVTQWEHLRLRGGGLAPLAMTVRFERMAEDLEVVAARLGVALSLPHKNRSDREGYQRYHTPRTREIVAKANAPLIRRFGYRYDG